MIQREDIGGDAPLAHAYLERLGKETSVRVLHIKGPVSAAHGLTQRVQHSDADVVVPPGDFERLCSALERHGWQAFRDADAPRLVDVHSRAYRRVGWSCSIDVHRFYPGFFADPDTAFEYLWRHRIDTSFASWTVTSPQIVDLAAIAAVHATRDAHRSRSQQDLSSVAERLQEPDVDLDDLIMSVTALRAGTTLTALFERLGLDVAQDLSAREAWAWRVLSSNDGETTAIHWYAAWRTSTWRQRFGLARSAFRALAVATRDEDAEALTRGRLQRAHRKVRAAGRDLVRARKHLSAPTPGTNTAQSQKEH